ncbi:MAG: hypothetical protein ABEI57_08215 [Halapricum sp.]
MTSHGDVQPSADRQLRLDADTQALVAHDSLHPSLSLLPAAAYQQLLIVSPRPPSAIERLVRESGGDLSAVGHLPLAATDHGYDGPLWTTDSIDPSDLTGLSMQYNRALAPLDAGHGWVLFDDFNTLLLYTTAERVVRFFDHLTQRTRTAGVRGVFTVVRDAMDDQTYASLQRFVDTEVDLR